MFLFSIDGLGKLSTLSYNNRQKRIIHEFSTSTISSRRKTYTYFGSSAGSGGKKGGIGSKGHTQCPHCGYTMFHKDTTLGKSEFSYNNTYHIVLYGGILLSPYRQDELCHHVILINLMFI